MLLLGGGNPEHTYFRSHFPKPPSSANFLVPGLPSISLPMLSRSRSRETTETEGPETSWFEGRRAGVGQCTYIVTAFLEQDSIRYVVGHSLVAAGLAGTQQSMSTLWLGVAAGLAGSIAINTGNNLQSLGMLHLTLQAARELGEEAGGSGSAGDPEEDTVAPASPKEEPSTPLTASGSGAPPGSSAQRGKSGASFVAGAR